MSDSQILRSGAALIDHAPYMEADRVQLTILPIPAAQPTVINYLENFPTAKDDLRQCQSNVWSWVSSIGITELSG